MSEYAECGCLSGSWSRYTEDDGTVVEYKHSCDYEQQDILDDSQCQFAAQQAALQGLATALEAIVEYVDDYKRGKIWDINYREVTEGLSKARAALENAKPFLEAK